MEESRRFRVRAQGEIACFTRPEMKVERVSYEVMTPSAARGVLESILWKPAIAWRVHEIAVLAPIKWTSFRRNEVNDRASTKGGAFFADERRAQRSTVALRDVDYVITASFAMTAQQGPDDNVRKFEEMFERRLAKGQFFKPPYLGCRELFARVEPSPTEFRPHDAHVDRPLGLMLYDMAFGKGGVARPLFFEARLSHGVMFVPPFAEVLAENQKGGGR